MQISDLRWIPVIVLLAYTVPACYYDLTRREMPEGFWNAMAILCIPATLVIYVSGRYPLYLAALSLAAGVVYLGLRVAEWYQGADLVYLLAISFFLVENPVTGHVLMPVSFGIFLIAAVVVFAIAIQTQLVKNMFPDADMGKFPMMLPISLALWLTVMIA